MIKDKLTNINLYYSLDSELKNYKNKNIEEVKFTTDYLVNPSHSELFIVEKGSYVFTTGWRESPEVRDVNALFFVNEGEFVLYLPGEPILGREINDKKDGKVLKVVL